MTQRFVQVDAFTNTPFAGNPAAVLVLPGPAPDSWMQSVAREMNLAETAFLHHEGDGYRLRWFTPAVEVDLCGHATLASAHVLWQDGHLPPDEPARFYTRSGVLTAAPSGQWIELDFPAEDAEVHPAPPALREALGVELLWVGRNRMDYLVELPSEETVRSLRPDLRTLATVAVRGVIVTAPSTTPGIDFVSRFFGPAAGVDEDPVTGSAHCALGPYWGAKLGRTTLTGYQASARGGVVRVRLASGGRTILGGQAVTVLTGALESTVGP